MSAYTGWLIRRKRMELNYSQEGLAKGICAVSYLSKIEQGLVEPGQEILDRLFDALGIDFVRDPVLEKDAQAQLDRFFFLFEADEPYDEQRAFFEKHGERLACSEFALSYQVYRLISEASVEDAEQPRAMLAQLEPFMHCLPARLAQWVLIVRAEYEENPEDEWAVLCEAARLRSCCVATYKLAVCAYRRGQYSLCAELAERAYSEAAYEGNPATMIWSCHTLGACACNRHDMEQAVRYYERVRALTRGYRIDMGSYIDYNLGSSYLEMGRDEDALRYLERAREVDGDVLHNTLLHQKLSILYHRLGRREEAQAQLALAQACFDQREWPAWRRPELIGQMLGFARLLLDGMENTEAFERITRALYNDAGTWFGHGFRRFYGSYLVQLCKAQRRYKEALALSEEMAEAEMLF